MSCMRRELRAEPHAECRRIDMTKARLLYENVKNIGLQAEENPVETLAAASTVPFVWCFPAEH
jgi:hypothetical protein